MFLAMRVDGQANYHGLSWIKHFDAITQGNLQSPDKYHLIICDGHDSHISTGMVNFCIQNRIYLILLPPHSSHLSQPLDVAVLGPLKHGMSLKISRLLRSGITRI